METRTQRVVFTKAGAKIPMHTHVAPEAEHLIFVVQGRLKVTENGQVMELSAPSIHLFPRDVPHEIEALEDGSSYVNLLYDTVQVETLRA